MVEKDIYEEYKTECEIKDCYKRASATTEDVIRGVTPNYVVFDKRCIVGWMDCFSKHQRMLMKHKIEKCSPVKAFEELNNIKSDGLSVIQHYMKHTGGDIWTIEELNEYGDIKKIGLLTCVNEELKRLDAKEEIISWDHKHVNEVIEIAEEKIDLNYDRLWDITKNICGEGK